MTTSLNESQRAALLSLADLTARTTAYISTPQFGHVSTARALERRGLVCAQTYPVEGFRLTAAGRAAVESLRTGVFE